VQLATTCEDQVIVGEDVGNAGSDTAQMAPMAQQVIERTGGPAARQRNGWST
jgi:replication-associated recombination protein RarA